VRGGPRGWVGGVTRVNLEATRIGKESRSEASGANILANVDARFARAGFAGEQGSTESRPTFVSPSSPGVPKCKTNGQKNLKIFP